MKKVRITLRDNKKTWSFPVYESLASYIYLQDKAVSPNKFTKIITLSKGEFLEIEWIGADYYQLDMIGLMLKQTTVPDNLQLAKCDNVRIAKSSRKSGRKGFDYVIGHVGWVPGDVIPWNNRSCPVHLKVIELKGRHKPKVDFDQLFQNVDSNILPDFDAEEFGIATC